MKALLPLNRVMKYVKYERADKAVLLRRHIFVFVLLTQNISQYSGKCSAYQPIYKIG